MKFSYSLARLCGSVHDGANVVFATLPPAPGSGPDGGAGDELLFSAVGNRVSVFELTKHASYTLPVECRSDVSRLVVNRAGTLILAIDEEGRGLAVSVARRVALHRFNFKGRVRCASFSPDDHFLAVCVGAKLQIWHAPGTSRNLAPFMLHATLAGHAGDVTSVDWSPDGRFLITGSTDATAR